MLSELIFNQVMEKLGNPGDMNMRSDWRNLWKKMRGLWV